MKHISRITSRKMSRTSPCLGANESVSAQTHKQGRALLNVMGKVYVFARGC